MTNVLVDVKFSGDNAILSKNNHPLAYGSKIHNIFTFNAISAPKKSYLATNAPSTIGANLWHQRMCHTNYNTLETMSRQRIAEGLDDTINYKDAPICSHCPFGKHARLSFKYTEPLSLNIGDLIVSDVCGPFDTSMGGYRYFITWIDARTRYTSIDFLKDKQCSTVTSSFNNYLRWLQNQKGTGIKVIRTDNGGEYNGHEFEKLCRELGIIHQTTSPYTPEHNSIAEQYNRTLQEGALVLQHQARFSNRFWVSGIHTVNFVRMRTLHT